MFAVIRTGGKQYKVAPNDVIVVEKLDGEPGATVELAEVLMVGDGATVSTGTPLLAGASVSATLVEQRRADKIIVFKKKRRQNYRRKNGREERIGESGSSPTVGQRHRAGPQNIDSRTGPPIVRASRTGRPVRPAFLPRQGLPRRPRQPISAQ